VYFYEQPYICQRKIRQTVLLKNPGLIFRQRKIRKIFLSVRYHPPGIRIYFRKKNLLRHHHTNCQYQAKDPDTYIFSVTTAKIIAVLSVEPYLTPADK
jgi:hypothetical protein